MAQDVNYFVLTLPVTFMKYCPKCGVELLVVQNLQAHLDLCLLSSNYDLKTIDNLKKTKLKKCSNCQKTCPECDYNSQDIYFFSNPCIRKAYLFNLNFLCCPNCVYNSKKKSRFQVNLFMKESDTIAPFVIRYFNLKMI